MPVPQMERSDMDADRHPAALVTGASRGISKAVALALSRQGFAVAVNYASSREAALAVQDEIQSAGGRAEIIQADVSLAPDRQRLVQQTLAAFGRIDLLVNN